MEQEPKKTRSWKAGALLVVCSLLLSVLIIELSYRVYLFGWDSFSIRKMNSVRAIGASGMLRFAEVANQIRGRAGEHQIDGARRALGHAYGGGSQYFSMWILGDQPLG